MTFLKRVWATLTTLPVYAGTLSIAVAEGAHRLAETLPNNAAVIVQVSTDVVAVIGFGSWVVTRVTPVAKNLRGFPAAPVSQKLQDAQDVAALVPDLQARVAQLEAEIKAAKPPAPALYPDGRQLP